MSDAESIHHLERSIAQLKNHVTEQDGEIFRLSKMVESLARKMDKLEKHLSQSGVDSPVDPDMNPLDERPPHY